MALGCIWIGIFVARPMFLPRSRVLLAYGDEDMIDPVDTKLGWAFMILTFGLVWFGYSSTESKHPYTVPLQAGETKIAPLPVKPNPVSVRVTNANSDVP